jgi:trigger factor
MKKTYTLKMKGKDWSDCIDKAFKNKRKDIKMDGFRKGQVPKEVYIKKYGVESLYMDAVDFAVDILYGNLIKDEETITPAATPAIDIKDVNREFVEIEFTLVSTPEVKMGKYKNLGLKKEVPEVTDEEIEHELGHIKEQFVDIKSLDEKTKIKDGHVAVIDFEGFLNGEAFKGGKGENYSLTIGSNTFIPGFEEGLLGLKKGDKKDLKVTFPENYQSEDLKGKEVTFKVEVKEVKERVMPEFNNDFFKDLGVGGVSSLEELKNYIKENMVAEKSKQIDDEFLFKCLDKINEDSKYEIPEEMTEDETNRLVKEFSEKLQMQGLKLDDYLKYCNSDMNTFKGTLKDEANKRVGYRLLLDEVVKQEKLEITDKELDEGMEEAAKNYNMTVEQFLESIGSKDLFRYDLLMKKAIEIITGEKQK